MLRFYILIILGLSAVGSLGNAQLLQNPQQSISLQNSDIFSEIQANKRFSSLAEALADGEAFLLNRKEAFNIPSLAFAISVKGKTIFENAWGWADLENSVPATLTTKYRLASVSKTFTSALVGTLVDQGLLKYEDPISKYLPATVFPHKSWKGTPVNITLAQLLSHTAGTFATDVLHDLDNLVSENNCTQLIHKFARKPLLFAPGSNMTYSNYGFQLVGAIIESVTKKTFQEAVGQLFQKLGLNSSYAYSPTLLLSNRARHYRSSDQEGKPKESVPTLLFDEAFLSEGLWPAGGLLSTVGDLIKYGNALLDSHKGAAHALLSKATLKEMWTPRTTRFPSYPYHGVNEYGYGWVVTNISKMVNPKLNYPSFNCHTGGMVGATTFFSVYPKEEMVVAILTNKGAVPAIDQMAIYMAENIYPFFSKNN